MRMDGVVVLLLGGNAYLDLKRREISLLLTGMQMVYGILRWKDRWNSADWLLHILILMLFVIWSLASGGRLGFGDALQIGALGMAVPIWILGRTLLFAFTGCLFMGLFCVMRNTEENEKELPLVPFLLAGYFGGVLWR